MHSMLYIDLIDVITSKGEKMEKKVYKLNPISTGPRDKPNIRCEDVIASSHVNNSIIKEKYLIAI